MTVSTYQEAELETQARVGTIIAISYSAELKDGVAKELHESAAVTRWGIPGDKHYGETRMSQSQGGIVPNLQPISVCGIEAANAACERLGIPPVPHGGLGENILVEGLGDLSDIGPGDQIHITSPDGELKVALETYKQNPPCSNLMVYHRLMVKELFGRRGIFCTVLKEGEIRLGDRVNVVRDGAELFRG